MSSITSGSHASDSELSVHSSPGQSSAEEEEFNTDEEITSMKQQKSKKTLKRKRRATDSTNFGATLQTILGTDVPATGPLALKPSSLRKRNDQLLESRAKRAMQVEKKEGEEKGHVTNIIGGWGTENERALRKVAQRGVVRLFNTIQQAQLATTEATDQSKLQRGSGKPRLPAPNLNPKNARTKGQDKAKPAVGNKQNTVNMDKDGFLDMIRTGGIVAKS